MANTKQIRSFFPTLEEPMSQLCTRDQFEESIFKGWCKAMKREPQLLRKLWEWVYIMNGLDVHDMLQPGRWGLGFGVGQEPITALLALHRCNILATDKVQDKEGYWRPTGQHAANLQEIPYKGLCYEPTFLRQVSFWNVDMNNIPADILTEQYDFCWSSSSLDHLGSIRSGLDFIYQSLKCLKPGGVAIHTTEYNISHPNSTLERGSVVFFRKKDMEAMVGQLLDCGHEIEMTLSLGGGTLEKYRNEYPTLKVDLNGFTATSIGLIIKKGPHNA